MLSVLIFLPLVFAVFLLFIKKPKLCYRFAGVFSCFYFLLVLLLFFFFDPFVKDLQLVQHWDWFPALGLSYFVGIDGLSFWLVILTGFLSPLCVFSARRVIREKISLFYFCLFAMNTSVMGAFLAMDALLFYIFFESSLIPLYFIIGIWGGRQRIYATFKFFIYTAFSSLFLLAGILALMGLVLQSTGEISALLPDFYKLDLPFVKGSFLSTQNVLFLCFFFAFAVKLPFVPFHTWLPLAHVEAPAPGSAVLAAVILKLGAYGFFRFVLPLFPMSVEFFSPALCLLAGLALVYGAFMALAQTNMKKLVAYASVSHMAYIVLGIFSLNIYGFTGAYYQMLTHAVSSAGLFFLIGMIYERGHSLKISDYGGLAKIMPVLAVFFIIISFSTIALPSTAGFISEFLILVGAFTAQKTLALIFALSAVVFGAGYMLYLVHRVFLGEVSPLSQKLLPLTLRETAIILPLVILVFGMGLFPKIFLKYSAISLNHLLETHYELKSPKGLSSSSGSQP